MKFHFVLSKYRQNSQKLDSLVMDYTEEIAEKKFHLNSKYIMFA